jgi:hypothetical protein
MVLRAAALALLLAAPAAAETLRDAGQGWSAELEHADEAARWPALDAMLRDSARALLDDFAGEAAVTVGPDDRPWEFWLRDEVRFRSDRYVSVLRTLYVDTGGAHGMPAALALIWDETRRGEVALERLLDPVAAAEATTPALRDAVARDVHRGAIPESWAADVEAAIGPDALRNATLVPAAEAGRAAGLDVHFGPYAVGPYSAGMPTVRLGWAVFEGALTEEGRALFSGTAAE